MCVIVLKEENGKLNSSIFDQCWARNGDGGGYVAIHNGKVIMEKGIMNKDEFLKKVKPFFNKGSQLILHFRIQSRGGVSVNLTHPFDCSQEGSKTKRYLFHNGTVKAISALSVGESDTSTLANWLKVLSDEDCKKMLENLVSKGHGRFVFVVGTKIYHWGDEESVEKKKVWYSNTRHELFNPAKDKRPTMGDGCEGDFFGLGGFRGGHHNDYDDMYHRHTQQYSSLTELEEAKKIIINDILKIESINTGIIPSEYDEWKEEIIKDYELLKLTTETLKSIKNSTSKTPLIDYFLATP
jgi:hypothetical protein